MSGGKNVAKGLMMVLPPLLITGVVVEDRLSEHNRQLMEDERKELTRDFFDHFDQKTAHLEGSAEKVTVAADDVAKYKAYLKQHGIDLDAVDPNKPADPEAKPNALPPTIPGTLPPSQNHGQSPNDVAAGPSTVPPETSTTTSTTVTTVAGGQ